MLPGPISICYPPIMIAHLRGIVHKLGVGEVVVDVQGVGYRVSVPVDVWDRLEEAKPALLWTSSYIREDRFDLFGFPDRHGLTLFEALIKLQGIGPRLGLELCSVPRNLLFQAATGQDPALLTNIKGVGKKTAEKLVLELRSLIERDPNLLQGEIGMETLRNEFDQDAIAALAALGYDSSTILQVLKDLPPDLHSTEERVAAALRSL